MTLSHPNCMLYIYIGLITYSPISMIYLLVSVWQWSVRHIGIGHWASAATEMTHRLQRRPSICLAFGHCLVFFWNDSGARFYAGHFPVGTEHSCRISPYRASEGKHSQ